MLIGKLSKEISKAKYQKVSWEEILLSKKYFFGSSQFEKIFSTFETKPNFYDYINYSFFTCIFYINKNQAYFSDSIKCPVKYSTLAKRILQVSVPMDRHPTEQVSKCQSLWPTAISIEVSVHAGRRQLQVSRCRSVRTDAVSNVPSGFT